MIVEWRPMASWPHRETALRPSQFQSTFSASLDLLERELHAADAEDVVIGVVAGADQFTMMGRLRADARIAHRGVEVSLSKRGKRLVFQTAVFPSWQDNLRAIALGLEALRKVERYGIVSGDEQYAGFAQIEAGPVARGRRMVEEAGSYEEAAKRWHSDVGGDDRAMADLNAYRDSLKVKA